MKQSHNFIFLKNNEIASSSGSCRTPRDDDILVCHQPQAADQAAFFIAFEIP